MIKKYHITFNDSVYSQLRNLFTYIATNSSSKIAHDILDGIEKQIISLESMPERFAVTPEKITFNNLPARHCFYKKSFRIIYTIYGNTVRILDVRHSAQNYVTNVNVGS